MEQQIKKEKEQFLLKVSVSVIVAMDSAPPFSGFKPFLGVKLKPTNVFHSRGRKNIFYLAATFVLQPQTFSLCSFKLSWMKELWCPVLSGWHTAQLALFWKSAKLQTLNYWCYSIGANFWSQSGKTLCEVVQNSTTPVDFCSLCFLGGDNKDESSDDNLWNNHRLFAK